MAAKAPLIGADMGPAAFTKFFETLGVETAASHSSVEYLGKLMSCYSNSPPTDYKIPHKTDLDVARELDIEFKRFTMEKILEKVLGGEKRIGALLANNDREKARAEKKLQDAKEVAYAIIYKACSKATLAKAQTKQAWRDNEDKEKLDFHDPFVAITVLHIIHVSEFLGNKPEDVVTRQNQLEDAWRAVSIHI